uniref:Uncharacterized protein n=1 Tax=Eutreptiella gymnastica TaxID=73025 RepID=A0A7S1IRJ9_9EUGL
MTALAMPAPPGMEGLFGDLHRRALDLACTLLSTPAPTPVPASPGPSSPSPGLALASEPPDTLCPGPGLAHAVWRSGRLLPLMRCLPQAAAVPDSLTQQALNVVALLRLLLPSAHGIEPCATHPLHPILGTMVCTVNHLVSAPDASESEDLVIKACLHFLLAVPSSWKATIGGQLHTAAVLQYLDHHPDHDDLREFRAEFASKFATQRPWVIRVEHVNPREVAHLVDSSASEHPSASDRLWPPLSCDTVTSTRSHSSAHGEDSTYGSCNSDHRPEPLTMTDCDPRDNTHCSTGSHHSSFSSPSVAGSSPSAHSPTVGCGVCCSQRSRDSLA